MVVNDVIIDCEPYEIAEFIGKKALESFTEKYPQTTPKKITVAVKNGEIIIWGEGYPVGTSKTYQKTVLEF